jgi:hypothetical protein
LRKTLILRAGVAAAVAIAITFTQAHNALVGLIAVLAFATGVLAAEVWQAVASDDRQLKGTVIRFAAGTVLLSGVIGYSMPGAPLLEVMNVNVLLVGYALFTIEIFRAVRAGWRTPTGRDHLVVAAIHILLTGLFFMNALSVIELGEVPAVGFFGAYTAILAVLWGLRAFDPKQQG